MSIQIDEVPLAHFNERPSGTKIDTVIVHCMWAQHAPVSDYFDPATCFAVLDRERVSAHYSIARDGKIFRHVPDDKRAWHAGVSHMPAPDRRENVNDFSIGIELIGDPEAGFTSEQYSGLTRLAKQLLQLHPIANWLGHDDVSPGRKVDPGPKFNWERFLSGIGVSSKTAVVKS